MNRVIIAEKPDMGANIAKALGGGSKKRGYIELFNGDVVTWGIGHLVRLKTPDAYEQYKQWTWDALPVIPPEMQTEVDPKKLDQFKIVKELVWKSKEVVLATDPDREGEYIGRLILHQIGYTKSFKRLWIDDLTEATILSGMKSLRSSDEFTLLGQAAQGRSYADYWLGFTASRFFTLLANETAGTRSQLSAGRVQTPTLRLVYDREIAMENFTPTPLYSLTADFHTSSGKYKGYWITEVDGSFTNRIPDRSKIEDVRNKIAGKIGTVSFYSNKQVKRQPPQLFNSSSLKTAARKQLGFSTVLTTKILQALYDKGYVSYPRADAKHLSENKADELAQHLRSLKNKSVLAHLFPEDIVSLKGKSRFVDDKKAASHHAIVPVLYASDAPVLQEDEQKLYELILKHTLAAHYPDGLDIESEIHTRIEGELFKAKSVAVLYPGWRTILASDKDDTEDADIQKTNLPIVHEGTRASVHRCHITEGQTSKPKRLNDDELEKLMENAGRFVDDENLDDEALLLIKEKGIGTPATRTNIVQSLVAREYIEIKKNLVYLTAKGRSFMAMVYHHPVASIELTGEFEMKLREVEKGRRSLDDFLQEIKTFSHDILNTKTELQERIRQLMQQQQSFDNHEEVGVCPLCSSKVVAGPKSYYCFNRSAGCTFSFWKEFRGVTIRTTQAQNLLLLKDVLLKGISNKEGTKTYDMVLYLKDGQLMSRFPSADDASLGACPLCGKPVIVGKKAYGCSAWREGCKFTLWKEFRSIEWTPKQITQLLSGKEILVQDIPKDSGSYSLYVQLKDGQISTRTPTAQDQSLGPCPRCKKPVLVFEKVYGCSDWRSGCTFRLSKIFLEQSISSSQMKKLLKTGKTDKIENLKGSKGLFAASLGYDAQLNRYTFLKG